MSNRELKKYIQSELQRDNNERKTTQEKYKRYNIFMLLLSLMTSVTVIAVFILLFDYLVVKPQDDMTNEYFSEQTAVLSEELAGVLMCNNDDLDDISFYQGMDARLSAFDIKMIVLKYDAVLYNSQPFNPKIIEKDMALSLDHLRQAYIIEKHIITDSPYTLYYLVPKSDNQLFRKTFLYFIAVIIMISSLFRSGLSHNIMKRVYKNMVEPLQRLNEATNNIRKGDLTTQVRPSLHYNRELKETFNDFEKMRQQLKENKDTAQQYEQNRKDLVSNISHDLKTPIASIIGYVEGILDGVANTPAKRDRYMQIIYKKSLDMNRLVNDLILFSKLDVNKVAFDFKKTTVQHYMESLFEDYGIELRENNIELISRYQANPELVIDLDQKQLRRVFNNIIGNAMKHLDKDTKAIEILVYEEQQEVYVRISDNGAGIPSDKVDHIFDRFYKADVARNTDIGSSGLGLSISKQIVSAHGGRIWATSTLGEGTIVYFTLSKKEATNG